ncbi:MAG: carboxypeptidase M32 [Candidatus Bathyarchaeia archaeon]|jgi:carboxypeptidase Taq
MSKNTVITEIVEKYKPIWALDHVQSLLEWDMETYMPIGASKSRGFAQAQTALIKQQRMLELAGHVSKAEKLGELNDYEKGILRVIKRDLDYYMKIPPKLLEDLRRISTEATVVWREARRKSDFPMFKGYLEKIVDLKKQEAEKLGYIGHPYNALMNLFEEELTTNDVDRVFSPLVPDLKRILNKVVSEGKFPNTHPLESVAYDEAAMRRVNLEALKLLAMPEKTFRMDVSTHPFTTCMSVEDVRITTRYEGKDFKESLFSTIHESGHAIYDLQVDPSLEYTPLSRGNSLGVHESQSRFWENFIGRSKEFTKLVYPTLKANLPFVSGYSEEEIYRYFCAVKPSPIRVDADELTYNFHIVLRYELEKKLIGGEIAVSEAPSLWSDLMEKYVGVRPKDDAHGVLQDVHWSGGGFGYFPTYSLGNVIAGMFFQRIKKDMDTKELVRKGELGRIKTWLKEKIHNYGATYSPKELQKRLFGEEYNPEWLVKYLEEKYTA